MRGLGSALAWHKAERKASAAWARLARFTKALRSRSEPRWKVRLRESHDPTRWRHGGSPKRRPRFAIVEKAVVPRLRPLSDDAIRVYHTVCLFVNGKTGIAELGEKRLRRELFFIPYHTHFQSGRTRVGLKAKQRKTRDGQIAKFRHRVRVALDELELAGLVDVSERQYDKKRSYVFTVLHLDGTPRKLVRLKHSDSFYMVHDALILQGCFGMYLGNAKRQITLLSELPLRVLMLALRDNDELRWGGVDPHKVWVEQGAVACAKDGWPLEQGVAVIECERAVDYLVASRVFRPRRAVLSTLDDHLIRLDGRPAMAADEKDVIMLRI